MVNVNDGTVTKDINILTETTVVNYIIVQCDEKFCVKTNGYINNGKDFQFGSGTGIVAVDVVDSCKVEEDIGKNVKNGGVCIMNVDGVIEAKCKGYEYEYGYDEINEEEYVLLKNNNPSIFSDNENSMKLLVNRKYIIRDRLYTGGNI